MNMAMCSRKSCKLVGLFCICMLLSFSIPSIAVRSIDSPLASPDGLLVASPTPVTITAIVTGDPYLIPSSVNVMRLNDNLRPIGVLARLYDDGTHGDNLPADGVFSNVITLNEPNPTIIHLQVTAAYYRSLLRTKSSVFDVDVVPLMDDATYERILDANQKVSDSIEVWRQVSDDNAARQRTLQYLGDLPNVIDAGVSSDNSTVWVNYAGGIKGVFLFNPIGTRGSCKILAPFFYPDETVLINQKLGQTCNTPDPILTGDAVTVDAIKSLYQYEVVVIATHGAVDGDGQVIFLTHETATIWTKLLHIIDLLTGRLAISGDNYFAIRPSFIDHYASSRYPNSLIYLGACETMGADNTENRTMADAFLSNGAAVYFGWLRSVNNGFAIQTGENLFTSLVDNKMTAQEAFNALGNLIDPNSPNAEFMMVGDGSHKVSQDAVMNGNFETGSFTGWLTGFQYGCPFPGYASPGGYTAVSAENPRNGSYGAKIGRWDQLYAGGAYGPAVYGAEPCGYDYIYQDIKVPSGSPTLEFDFNLRTFDAEPWDWLDVFIKNSETNADLATVVSNWGKPGEQYGTYWDGGWQHISFSLAPWEGQTIRLWFGNRQDGFGDQNVVYIDNVSVGCGGMGSPKALASEASFVREHREIDKTQAKYYSEAQNGNSTGLPTKFDLLPNHPNPFNPTTVISFALPSECETRLEIFNITGQKVKSIVSEQLPAGYYSFTWDGTDELGAQVSSGIYLYRLQASDFISTKKMLLLK